MYSQRADTARARATLDGANRQHTDVDDYTAAQTHDLQADLVVEDVSPDYRPGQEGVGQLAGHHRGRALDYGPAQRDGSTGSPAAHGAAKQKELMHKILHSRVRAGAGQSLIH